MKTIYSTNRWIALLSLLLLILITSTNIIAASKPIQHPAQPFPPKMQQFIDTMVKQYHFKREPLVKLFSQAEILPQVVQSIEKPLEKKHWDFYKGFFISKKRIDGGAAYWQTHQKTLAEAKQKYGVEPSVIVAIIGIESNYGSYQAQFKELSSLTTLAFYHKPRAAFFQNELKQFLLMSREMGLTPEDIGGSYAGALGIPQFMPSSYRHYALSYDDSKHADLLTNHDDAIFSIANYLKQAGWQVNQVIATPAITHAKQPPQWLISRSANPIYRIKTMAKFGIHSKQNLPGQQKTALIAMDKSKGADEYWLVFPNFYAIMRYNPRTTYAMAVYQLSQAIQDKYERQTQTGRTTTASR